MPTRVGEKSGARSVPPAARGGRGWGIANVRASCSCAWRRSLKRAWQSTLEKGRKYRGEVLGGQRADSWHVDEVRGSFAARGELARPPATLDKAKDSRRECCHGTVERGCLDDERLFNRSSGAGMTTSVRSLAMLSSQDGAETQTSAHRRLLCGKQPTARHVSRAEGSAGREGGAGSLAQPA